MPTLTDIDLNSAIKARVFASIDKLIKKGEIKSYYAIAKQIGTSQANLTRLREKETMRVPFSLLSVLVSEYGVDGNWLLTGRK